VRVLNNVLEGLVKAILIFILAMIVGYLYYGYIDGAVLRTSGSIAVIWFFTIAFLLPYLRRNNNS
jgi:hypothetical protein